MDDDDQYGLPDLRRLMSTGPHFPASSHPQLEPFSFHRPNLINPAGSSRSLPPLASTHFQFSPNIQHHNFINITQCDNSNISPQGVLGFATDSSSRSALMNNSGPATSSPARGMELADFGDRLMMDQSGSIISSSRWPRQETLTLLEIRSRLDSKFKEANHKGPLWDEVSRIMSEEHGYQRSGKKCREKFENLYKYYKKTKEGKAGRQDGKNYRFFRQLEAIYGEPASSSINTGRSIRETNTSSNYKLHESVSFSISNSSSHELIETSSSENNEEYDLSAMAFAMTSHSMENEFKKNKLPRDDLGLKEKVKGFVESEMRKVMEKQEAWMENMLKTMEQREQERAWREVEWRKQETARFDREHEIWAKERAWIEARDAALMEALKKFIGGNDQLMIDVNRSISKAWTDHHHSQEDVHHESETRRSLVELRACLDSSFRECGDRGSSSDDGLWDVVAAKMTSLGHNLSGSECKEKWESVRASFARS